MPRPAPSVSRVVSVLGCLSEDPSEFLTLSEIARRLDLNKATAHGILAALTDAAYVIRHPDTGGYSLGPGLVRAGRAALAREYEVVALARNEMETLAHATQGQCAASAVDHDQILFIALAGAAGGPRAAYVGMRGPLLPPYGLVFMAWAPDGEIEAWLDAEELDDDGKARYRELLAHIRQRGYSTSADGDDRQRIEQAIETVIRDAGHADIAKGLRKLMTDLARDRSELSDVQPNGRYRVRLMAAPIFDTDGRVRIGLTLTGLPELTGTQVRDHGYALSAAAARISKRIGGRLPTDELADAVVAA